MRVEITEPAESDLLGIQNFIVVDNPERAASFIAELKRLCTVGLVESPHMGRARDDLSPGLRVLVHRDYLICYRVAQDVIYILRVMHGSFDIALRF